MNKESFRILVVDDEAVIVEQLRRTLTTAGYQTESARDGDEALRKTEAFHPHLILLDLGLPDMPGDEVLRRLRRWTHVPVIILTVQDAEEKKVQLLDAGADDYLCKPFGSSELTARVRVALRPRASQGSVEATPVFISDQLQVNVITREVSFGGANVHLTKTEFELLARLVRQNGQVVPQDTLMKEIWGTTNEDQFHYLRIYINQLRKKLEVNPSTPKHILTEPGVGYRLV
jgi:two-component system KDP operon response regulator KdpE